MLLTMASVPFWCRMLTTWTNLLLLLPGRWQNSKYTITEKNVSLLFSPSKRSAHISMGKSLTHMSTINLLKSFLRLLNFPNDPPSADDANYYVNFVTNNSVPRTLSIEQVRKESKLDAELQSIKTCFENKQLVFNWASSSKKSDTNWLKTMTSS